MKNTSRIELIRKVEYWNEVSTAYADIAHYMTKYFAEKAIEYAGIQTTDNVLDVACGTGIVSLSLCDRVSKVTAVDFSANMLEIFKKTVSQKNIQNISIIQADGQNLPLPKDQFDVTFSMFGLLLFPDRYKGFRELNRTLKVGKKAIVSSWAPKAKSNLIQHMETAIQITLQDMPDTREGFPLENPHELEKEMTNAGFKEVYIHEVQCTFPKTSSRKVWGMMSNGSVIKYIKQNLETSLWEKVENNAIDYLTDVLENENLYSTAYIGEGRKEI